MGKPRSVIECLAEGLTGIKPKGIKRLGQPRKKDETFNIHMLLVSLSITF